MSDIVLCFDQVGRPFDGRGGTHATRLFGSVEHSAVQSVWYHGGVGTGRRDDRRAQVRDAVAGAYAFVREHWSRGDRLLVFGVGRAASRARALTRLLDTVGVLPDDLDQLRDYAIDAHALPRTPRTPQDWRRLRDTYAALDDDVRPVTVDYLGLWDARPDASATRPDSDPPTVRAGRHAMAADGVPAPRRHPLTCTGLEQAWFRGDHRDVTGGPGACEPWRTSPSIGCSTAPWRPGCA